MVAAKPPTEPLTLAELTKHIKTAPLVTCLATAEYGIIDQILILSASRAVKSYVTNKMPEQILRLHTELPNSRFMSTLCEIETKPNIHKYKGKPAVIPEVYTYLLTAFQNGHKQDNIVAMRALVELVYGLERRHLTHGHLYLTSAKGEHIYIASANKFYSAPTSNLLEVVKEQLDANKGFPIITIDGITVVPVISPILYKLPLDRQPMVRLHVSKLTKYIYKQSIILPHELAGYIREDIG